MAQRPKYLQVEVKLLAGSETWVMIRWNGREFKLPADAPISEMMRGVSEGWDRSRARRPGAPATLEEWRKWHVYQSASGPFSVRF